MERKPLRLPDYNYSQNGLYFLTLCAEGKAPLFGRVCVGGGALDAPCVKLSQWGEIVERWIADCEGKYEDLVILKHVIMPNHVHLVVELRAGSSWAPTPTRGNGIGSSGAPTPTRGNGIGSSGVPVPAQIRANERIPKFVSGLKRMTNRICGKSLWQRSYYDHVIRNEADFLRIWTYIDTNPAKWAEDEYFI